MDVTKELLPLEYETIHIGVEMGPAELVVDDHLVRTYAYGSDDFNPWYFGPSPFGGAVVPPGALLWSISSRTMWRTYDVATDKGVMSKEELTFLKAAPVGSRVRLDSRFVDKFVKRNEPYYVLEVSATDASGDVLVIGRWTEMTNMRPGLALGSAQPRSSEPDAAWWVESSADQTMAVASRASKGLIPGTPIPTLRKIVRFRQILAFAGPDRYGEPLNMHVNSSYAASIGLPAPIVPGILTSAYFMEAATAFFGRSWFETGQLRTQFLRPVYPDHELVIHGAVRETVSEAGASRQYVDLWCQRESEIVLVARASAVIVD